MIGMGSLVSRIFGRRITYGLGGGGVNNRSRRSWNVWRQILRLSVKATLSPGRILAHLRDSYTDIMISLAGGKSQPSALLSKGTSIIRDEAWGRRMMLHIYRSIVAAPEVIAF